MALVTLEEGIEVTDIPTVMLAKLFDYYLASDKSQSSFFKSQSFKADVGDTRNIEEAAVRVEESLTTLLGQYFVEVNVTVIVSTIRKNDLIIEIVVKDKFGKGAELSSTLPNTVELLNHEKIKDLRKYI